MQIITNRFLLRPLKKADVTERYLGWLADSSTNRFIETASAISGRHALESYVAKLSNRDDVLFLGIFDAASGEHIGNIKYEPIDLIKKYAVMGIMIGQSEWRGKGVAAEVIKSTAMWLKSEMELKEILLGVEKNNIRGISAYEKCGFRVSPSPKLINHLDNAVTMVLNLRCI